MKKKQPVIEKLYGLLVIDGAYFKLDHSKQGQMIAIPQDKKKVDAKLAKAKEMAAKLKDSLDGEKVLTEALMINFEDKDFEKLYAQLFKSKRVYKAKTREHHCVDMKVGNTIIPIVN